MQSDGRWEFEGPSRGNTNAAERSYSAQVALCILAARRPPSLVLSVFKFPLRQIMTRRHDARIRGLTAAFIFKCPATSINVQHWQDDDEDVPEDKYEGVACPACLRLHFLNRKTGKLLGQDRWEGRHSFAASLISVYPFDHCAGPWATCRAGLPATVSARALQP